MEEIDILNEIHGFCQCVLMDYTALACEYIFKFDIIWFILALLLLRGRNTRIISLTLIISLILDIIICYSLKTIVDRPRPFEVYPVDALITSFKSASFPSGHTAGAFCTAMVIYAFDRYKGAWLFLLALFIGFTRMYAYAHFPTDVMAGAALGIISALIVLFTCHRTSYKTVFVEVENREID